MILNKKHMQIKVSIKRLYRVKQISGFLDALSSLDAKYHTDNVHMCLFSLDILCNLK